MIQDNYFDHDADIGIIGHGKTLEDAFVSAAQVMFAMMANLEKIKPLQTCTFSFTENDIELAFISWLNLLLANSNANNVVFSQFAISHNGNEWLCSASGEIWNENMERGTDVKGATLTMLSVKKLSDEWEARCVVDV